MCSFYELNRIVSLSRTRQTDALHPTIQLASLNSINYAPVTNTKKSMILIVYEYRMTHMNHIKLNMETKTQKLCKQGKKRLTA